MQHLRAVVGHLRGLPVMQLRDEAGIGDGLRVGGEDPRDVLPEDDPAGAETAAEKGGREIGPAAAEGRQAAVGAGAEKAGDDRRHAAPEQRPQHAQRAAARRSDVGRGTTVVAIGDDHVEGIDVRGRATRRRQDRRDDGAGEAFAAGHEHVARAGRHVSQRADRAGQVPVLPGRGVGLGQEPPARGAARDQALDHGAVLPQERRRHGGARAGFPGGRAMGPVEESVGHAVQSGDDDDQRATLRPDERGHAAYRGGVGHRRPAELPDLQRPRLPTRRRHDHPHKHETPEVTPGGLASISLVRA